MRPRMLQDVTVLYQSSYTQNPLLHWTDLISTSCHEFISSYRLAPSNSLDLASSNNNYYGRYNNIIMLNKINYPLISSCIANWLISRKGIVLLKFTKIDVCLQHNLKIHYSKCKWTKKNGLIQDEADLWQNCLSNINNNSLIQDKNDINSSLVDVRIPA